MKRPCPNQPCRDAPGLRARCPRGWLRWSALVLVQVHLAMLVLASSARWHHELHDTEAGSPHHCLATLLQNGLVNAAPSDCHAQPPHFAELHAPDALALRYPAVPGFPHRGRDPPL